METVQAYFNNILSSGWFYLAICVIIGLIIFMSVFSNRKKKIADRIKAGQMKVNDMKSYPFSVDIAKTDAIAKVNGDLEDTAANIRTDFYNFQVAIKNIITNLQDAKDYLDANKFAKSEAILNENDKLIEENIILTDKMKDVLHGILNQSSIHRQRINELKNHFHDIKTVINEAPNDYTFCWEELDRITNDISHQFSDFESIMDASKYEDAAKISDEISASINDLNYIVQNIPDLIKSAKKEIPAAIDEVRVLKTLLQQKGAFIGHLNIDGIIEQVDNSLNEALASLKKCQLENVNEKLIDCQSKINQCTSNLQQEKNAFKDICDVSGKTETLLNATLEIIESIKKNNGTDFTRYGLADYNQTFYLAESRYLENSNVYAKLAEAVQTSNIPSTSTIIAFKEVMDDSTEVYNEIKQIQDLLSQSKVSEVRVRELISQFMIVLNESKIDIANSNLPSISDCYQTDFNEIDASIKDIETKLAEKSVNIKDVLEEIDETSKRISTLYYNVQQIIANAKNVEEFIISCNKYRPYNSDIANALCQAEIMFRNGEYIKASLAAANAIEKIDPEKAEAFTKKIKSNQGK